MVATTPSDPHRNRAPSGNRLGASWLLVAYLGFLAWVLFNPSANVASSVIHHAAAALHDLGLSATLATDSRVEFGLNALMFVPAAYLTALVWPRVTWQGWTTYAFIASGCVELIQGLFLPDRTAQFADVVSNSLGGLLGAGAAAFRMRWRNGDSTAG